MISTEEHYMVNAGDTISGRNEGTAGGALFIVLQNGGARGTFRIYISATMCHLSIVEAPFELHRISTSNVVESTANLQTLND